MNPGPTPDPQEEARRAALERAVAELERRVHGLEETVAGLRDTRQIEERITEKVAARVPPVPMGAVVEALARQPLPPAVKTLVDAAAQPSTIKQVAQSSWLAFDMVRECVAIFQMLLDRHYHMAWITRVLVFLLLAAIFTSGWWFPLSFDNWVGRVVDKLFDLVMAGVLLIALFCETRRHREWRAKRVP